MFDLQSYLKLNASFSEKLVFRLGSEVGIFSEINNMYLAMAYCLANRIQFCISSADSNFHLNPKARSGWQSFFEPFVKEEIEDWHVKYNFYSNEDNFRNISTLKRKIVIPFLKRLSGIDYLTQDVFHQMHSSRYQSKPYCIVELDFFGDLLELTSNLVNITWRLNDELKAEYQKVMKELELPKEYIAVHYRAGDKHQQCERIDEENYINEVRYSNPDAKEAFVLSDDYRSIENFINKTPWNIYTTCKEQEKGFAHKQFMLKSKKSRYEDLKRLIVGVEILSNAKHFYGTYSSSVGRFVGMRRNCEQVTGIDFGRWRI